MRIYPFNDFTRSRFCKEYIRMNKNHPFKFLITHLKVTKSYIYIPAYVKTLTSNKHTKTSNNVAKVVDVVAKHVSNISKIWRRFYDVVFSITSLPHLVPFCQTLSHISLHRSIPWNNGIRHLAGARTIIFKECSDTKTFLLQNRWFKLDLQFLHIIHKWLKCNIHLQYALYVVPLKTQST